MISNKTNAIILSILSNWGNQNLYLVYSSMLYQLEYFRFQEKKKKKNSENHSHPCYAKRWKSTRHASASGPIMKWIAIAFDTAISLFMF